MKKNKKKKVEMPHPFLYFPRYVRVSVISPSTHDQSSKEQNAGTNFDGIIAQVAHIISLNPGAPVQCLRQKGMDSQGHMGLLH